MSHLEKTPFPDALHWYASTDGGEHFGYRSKTYGQLVDELNGDGLDPEDVVVARGRQSRLNLADYFNLDDLEIWLDNVEEELKDSEHGGSEDGDYHPLLELKPELQRDLVQCIKSAIWHFQERKKLVMRGYYLVDLEINPNEGG